MNKINHFEMFTKILEWVSDSEDPDRCDDLELEWQEIIKKTNEWKAKVERIYNAMKEEGLIK